ncbi:DUF3109 family protein, partial [Rubrivirga sp.]|uniref:DUF3109 family protein n=1 Tax=Rubrivirga sp. TaxID=1885344 RepID=UPI003C78308E
PLEDDERTALEDALPVVEHRLRPEARAEIARRGVWEGQPGHYHTTTVRGRECVFVTYDGPVAKCSLQQAFWEGKIGFEKPVSCHLYPIRVETYGEGADATDVLNYETIELCKPAIPHGRKTGMQVADFLERPLTRKYGAEWVAKFRATLAQRRQDVGVGPVADLERCNADES